VPEWPRHHFDQAIEEYFFGLYRDRTGLDFRQVENIAD
jgi:hypothetical protein